MRNTKAKGAKTGRPQTTLDDVSASYLRHYTQYKNAVFDLRVGALHEAPALALRRQHNHGV